MGRLPEPLANVAQGTTKFMEQVNSRAVEKRTADAGADFEGVKVGG